MVLIYKFFIELSSYLFSNHPFKSLCESETAVSTWACETLLVTKGCTSRELMCVKAQRWINMFRGCFCFCFCFWWHALCFYSPFGGDGLSSGLVSVVCLLWPFSHAGHAVCRALRCFFKHPLDDSCQPLSLAAQGDHVPTCTRAWERPVLPRAASLWTGFEKTKLGSVCGYDGADSCSLKHIALSGSSSDSGFDTESN